MTEPMRESVIVRAEVREGRPGLTLDGCSFAEFISFTPETAMRTAFDLYELARRLANQGDGGGDGQPR